jgi:hypothetical protein
LAVTEKQIANLIPIKKGEVRNPTGRPKGRLSFESALERWLSQEHDNLTLPSGEIVRVTNLDEAIRQQAKKAREGDTYAFKTLMEFTFGKALQKIETETKEVTEFSSEAEERAYLLETIATIERTAIERSGEIVNEAESIIAKP